MHQTWTEALIMKGRGREVAFLVGAEHNRERKRIHPRTCIKEEKEGERAKEERSVSRGKRTKLRARKRTETNGEACLARRVLATLLSQVQRHASPSS